MIGLLGCCGRGLSLPLQAGAAGLAGLSIKTYVSLSYYAASCDADKMHIICCYDDGLRLRLRSEVSTFLRSHGSAAAAGIGSSSLIGGVWKTDSGLKHRPAEATRGVPRGVLRWELAPE